MLKLVTQNLSIVAAMGLLLFLPAGTLAWPQAWIFLLLFLGCGHATGYWLLMTNPEFLGERMKSPLRGNQTPRDRTLTVVFCVALCVWLVIMALDACRFGWSSTPVWTEVFGAGLVAATFYGWSRVLRANSFAVTSVRLQPQRGQMVISTGPYSVVRHPMYAVASGILVGIPLLLGSLWGLLGIFVFMPLLALRALGEEDILIGGLKGYRRYAASVRYRLFPSI